MEMENKYASRGVGNTALGLGIGAVAAELLGGLGGVIGNRTVAGCHEDHPVSRFEAAQQSKIEELTAEVKFRDANTYTDSKLLELYRYVDGRFNGVEAQICQQNVVNAQVTANLSCMQSNINTLLGLTKTIIPIDNICPEAMQRYNSWVAPTTSAA